MESMGYIEGVHYVVGSQPPKSFRQPTIDPKDDEHVISFYNGSVAVIISQDRPGSSNSLTLSWLLVDEAKFIDYAKLKDETLPANGGIKSHFGKHSFNHSIMILSDMPQTQKGSWFLHYRDLNKMRSVAVYCRLSLPFSQLVSPIVATGCFHPVALLRDPQG